MTRYLNRDRIAVLAALAAPLATAAILLPFRASWPNTNVALLLVVVVVGVAAIGNRVAGGLAAVGAALWFDFFFTLPYYRFTIRSSADVTTAVLLLLTGLAVSQIAARARRLQVIAITDAGCLAQIHETASLAKSATFPDAVVDHVKEQLTGLLGLQGCRFEYGSLLGHPPRLEPDGTVTAGHSRWDVEQSGLPRERSNCAPSATASTTAASCSRPSQARNPHCRPGWSPSRWPSRPDAPSLPVRPHEACSDEPAGQQLHNLRRRAGPLTLPRRPGLRLRHCLTQCSSTSCPDLTDR
jgi:Domain of unknown function (DUF4118)